MGSDERRSEVDSSPAMRLIEGARDLVDDHDVFLLDMWGVMHDGSRPFDGVLDVVQKLKEAGKKLIILSNSSKRKDDSVRMLEQLGFHPNDFDQIITSGEVAFQMLAGDETLHCERWTVLAELRAGGADKRKVFVFGSGESDKEYCESCGWKLAPLEEASLVIARGTFSINDGLSVVNKRDDSELYHRMLDERLKEAAERRLPMLVCNPDKVRPDFERPPMPGKIGDDYERALGGDAEAEALVKRVGKPFRDIYDIALWDTVDQARACMVGDALETDVAGGSAAGIISVWVLMDGIHSPEMNEEKSFLEGSLSIVQRFNRNDGTYAKGRHVSPNIILPHFRW
jgi:HAD superfamily hydrolase (TIGR01459 family)